MPALGSIGVDTRGQAKEEHAKPNASEQHDGRGGWHPDPRWFTLPTSLAIRRREKPHKKKWSGSQPPPVRSRSVLTHPPHTHPPPTPCFSPVLLGETH